MAEGAKIPMTAAIEIRLSGSGGQGLQLSASVLAEALLREGKRVAQSQSYEPTSRGGISRSDLVISEDEVDYPLVTRINYLVILDDVAARASNALIKPGATVLCDESRVTQAPSGDFHVRMLPFAEKARAVGLERVANMVALGTLAGLSGICPRATLEAVVRDETPAKFLDLNLEALAAGFKLAEAPVSE
ncbi:MAG: 2-oxoacid:acceptor oxidoreductase family protein [Rhodospirillales bacterium]|nr:2-oxoacid:acceptor oxidoreductase family protein [Rhodospirillales bacterium]